MELNDKFLQLLTTLQNALADFKKSLDADLTKYNELEQNWIKNAQIQKFEFCIELLWKTTKSYFESEGEFFLSPKQNNKALFLHNLLNEEQYLEMMKCLEDRNLLSHIYKLEMFNIVAGELFNHYKVMFLAFTALENEAKDSNR
jgi:nucleotidyltransferase substrate binding protein (TIGR01987 family)